MLFVVVHEVKVGIVAARWFDESEDSKEVSDGTTRLRRVYCILYLHNSLYSSSIERA